MKGHKRVKSDIPSNLNRDKLVVGNSNINPMNKIYNQQSKSKQFIKNMKITGNSYVLSTSKEEQSLI